MEIISRDGKNITLHCQTREEFERVVEWYADAEIVPSDCGKVGRVILRPKKKAAPPPPPPADPEPEEADGEDAGSGALRSLTSPELRDLIDQRIPAWDGDRRRRSAMIEALEALD